MIKQLMSLLLVVLLVCPSALARYRLPEGTRLQTPQGTFQGYSLEEMKVLLKMDVDLETSEKLIPKFKDEISALEQKVIALEYVAKSINVQLDLLKKDRDRLSEKWSQENKLRHECENKPSFGSWVAWTVAAVTTATALALGITLAVRESR